MAPVRRPCSTYLSRYRFALARVEADDEQSDSERYDREVSDDSRPPR